MTTAKTNPQQGRFRRIQNAVNARIRHPRASAVSKGKGVDWDPRMLRGRHCVLVSYRRDGTPVPTPIWVAVEGDRVFVRTGADAYKVKRIRRNPAVLLAPSTGRGRPTGPAMLGYARVLDQDEEPVAERALAARHGLLRRLYSKTVDSRLPTVYIEIGPAEPRSAPTPTAAPPSGSRR
ncbi:PPOX class F420-dependent oxidoreductase [Allorhizocola rhizosphaerae]|uniref:PPOX class F420-dependent oxidoreductase n=1 Tax=Allorhizocola rhizosphaerae TaxID=1872709 RepID=UPI000E3C873B|nr:PPOX class F420-dependent oxidoreductase [Allorhizocola rhizosphaerae]